MEEVIGFQIPPSKVTKARAGIGKSEKEVQGADPFIPIDQKDAPVLQGPRQSQESRNRRGADPPLAGPNHHHPWV
jgi:hypothetical protein